MLGDATMDGKVDINDATALQRFVAEFEAPTERQKELGDVNRDGKVDVQDATMIQRYIAEFIDSF